MNIHQAVNGAYDRRPAVSKGQTTEVTPDLELPCFTMTFSANEEIFGEQEPADFIYKVLSGSVRTVRLLSDGRRQVSGFHLPGDVFGLECGETHRGTAEAIETCEIALVRRNVAYRAAEGDSAATRQLWLLTARDLQRAQDHLVLLGQKTALERVGGFLVDMADRYSSGDVVDLPMSRGDIADFLGLTVETISRTLSQLIRVHAIALPTSRHVVLKDFDLLAAA